MAADLDIVGTAGVDIVPVVPDFHNRVKAQVLPAADRIGRDVGQRIGEAISANISVSIPDGVVAGGRRARVAADREGGQVGGAFGRSVKRKLEEAFRSLPRADVRLGDTGINADIDRLRARIQTLSGKTVGIDIDAGAALAEIADINARLERLAAENPSIQIQTDTAAARAALAEVQHQLNGLDRDDVHIRVKADTAGAMASLRALTIALGAVAALPVIPVAAAGIGSIASAAVAAGAGVGALALVAIPAIKGVTSAMQAKTAADKEAASASDNSAASGVKAAQQALQMASAQQALTSAHRQAAQSIEAANRRVEDAERSVAQAVARAMDQRRQAAESVERAERSLSDAQRQARQAQDDLTAARRTAAQQLADLNDKLADGALSQREAALRVTEAADELNRVKAAHDAGTASDSDLARAQLSYDQAVQAQKEQGKQYKQLQDDAKKARKEGVDGNDDVKRAAQRLADAQRNVQDQTKAVADAQRAAARAQVEAAQSVADAQRNLSDAVANVADVQVQAADSIASAERGVEAARLSSVDTTKKSSAATDAYRQALAKLSPEQRRLYDSIAGPKGLKAAFSDWSKSMSPDVVPLLTRAVNGAKSALPGLTPLVKAAADAVGILFDDASRELKTPFWRGFKKDIDKSAKPAIVGFGRTFGNVIKGAAGVIDAFLPHIDDIADRMVRSSGKFAKWGSGLKGSPQFEAFLKYANDKGPLIAQTLGAIAGAFLAIGSALAPISTPLLQVIGAVASGIASVADTLPWLIQLIYGVWVATKLWTLAMAAFTLVVDANPIVLIVAGIVALVAAVIYAYKHFGWFRDLVQSVWHGIQTAALWAWDNVLKPTFDAIRDAVKFVGDVLVWLWKNVLVPAWNGIALVAKVAMAIIGVVLIAPLVIAFNLISAVLEWLWKKQFKPAFEDIAAIAKWLWENGLKPQLQVIWDGVKWVGDKFVWFYDHAVKPAAGWIADKAKWLWDHGLHPQFQNIWDGVKWVGDKFKWLYDHGVKPAANWIAEKTDWLYDKGVKPAFDNIKHGLKLVSDAFGAAKKDIKRAWDGVAGVTAKPVNFIVDAVYTHGIKAVWDKVAGFVGLGKLPKAPKLLDETPKFADGGRTSGGIPGKDSIPALLMADEYVIKRSSARKIGFGALEHMNRTGEIPRFANGGLVGGVFDWTKDVLGKGLDWAKTSADLMLHPGKVLGTLMKPVLSHVRDGVGTSPMGDALAKYPSRMVSGLKDKLVSAVTDMFSGGSGGGVGQWIKPVNVPYGTKFGVPGKMWASGHHTGLDFPAPVGTPVKAVDGGTVMSVGTAGPYGNHLEINHGGGLVSLYAHLSKTLVKLNQVVAQGQQIGKVGATGNVTGPHLHLEARVGGKAVDPMAYLTSIRSGGKVSQSIAAAKNFAKGKLKYFGWGPGQFAPLEKLWQGESGWRWNAENPSSGAYGIPQALPASKMASVGPDWRTNPATQIQWGMKYIKGRPDYGSPAAAYSKWLSRSPHWYDEGGYLPPGLSLVANGTGSPEPVFTSGQWDDIRAAKGTGSPQVQVSVESRTYLDGREVGGFVDQRIEAHDVATGQAIDVGRFV
ncbi:aggregation-promoting factor C-terminal-like domain-containing protein [Streptomyces sp. NPDC003273]|uniref:aggregation-promoting factor C-terminal-like domain-containing protein n=1 Tax=Streptomyces sp. NPDC003273 TaxID=3364678 RepID=UPI0036ADA895